MFNVYIKDDNNSVVFIVLTLILGNKSPPSGAIHDHERK